MQTGSIYYNAMGKENRIIYIDEVGEERDFQEGTAHRLGKELSDELDKAVVVIPLDEDNNPMIDDQVIYRDDPVAEV